MTDLFKEKDGNGYSKNSTIRVTMVIWTLVFSIVWAVISIASIFMGTPKMCDVPLSVIAITSLFVTGKVVQKFGERK